MAKTFKTMFWLALLAALSLAAAAIWPDLRYQFGDPRYRWLGSLLAQPQTEYAYLFVGSSHTWNGVAAPLAAHELGGDKKVMNIGVNWLGRDVDRILAEDFLDRHRVDNLVVEFRLDEIDASHNYFGQLCRPGDVIGHAMTRRIFEARTWNLAGDYKEPVAFALGNLAKCGVRLYRHIWPVVGDAVFGRPDYAGYMEHLGWYPLDPSAAQQKKNAAEFKPLTGRPRPADFAPSAEAAARPDLVWAVELDKLAGLCRARGVRLVFLGLPGRVDRVPSAKYLDYLSSLGEVRPMPFEIVADPANWRDAGHLNIQGARKLTGHFIKAEKGRGK